MEAKKSKETVLNTTCEQVTAVKISTTDPRQAKNENLACAFGNQKLPALIYTASGINCIRKDLMDHQYL